MKFIGGRSKRKKNYNEHFHLDKMRGYPVRVTKNLFYIKIK